MSVHDEVPSHVDRSIDTAQDIDAIEESRLVQDTGPSGTSGSTPNPKPVPDADLVDDSNSNETSDLLRRTGPAILRDSDGNSTLTDSTDLGEGTNAAESQDSDETWASALSHPAED
ncbi:hypothetical protein M011DRAFT_474205 [Sporormia fimetaria CBS 119925]|uniref:Uncharacterized protein n=1 Tax=Sporormia fimetaria CBS 119925 TaxID=1340428 RepID=A0A6A6VLM7_9PLEO|nr:hypothetical protein M011DRAFT_474205 [Sporormia fimetaria CBS 119925]